MDSTTDRHVAMTAIEVVPSGPLLEAREIGLYLPSMLPSAVRTWRELVV